RSAEAVLRVLFGRALDLFKSGGDVWCPPGKPMAKILSGEPLTMTEHLSIDDTDIAFSIKQWQRSEDAILADLSHRFLDRRLFKAFDLDMAEADRPAFLVEVRRI